MAWVVVVNVPGNPVGKGRPRVRRRGALSSLYTPEKTANYESLVTMAGVQAMAGRPLLDGPLSVHLDIRVRVPASWSKRKQAQALSGQLHPVTKPDIDNVEKVLFDGLNGVAWRDDVQVVKVVKRKRYSETPGVEMVIEPMDATFNVHQDNADGVVAADLLQAHTELSTEVLR